MSRVLVDQLLTDYDINLVFILQHTYINRVPN